MAAGALAAVNPCGFAMLPAYLALFIAGDQPPLGLGSALVAVRRALAATAAMTTGFLATFVTAGLVLSPVAATLQRWAPALTVVIGVGLAVMGLLMVTGRELTLPLPKPDLRSIRPRAWAQWRSMGWCMRWRRWAARSARFS